MGERRLSLEAKRLQQRFHQIYALSPWVRKEEFLGKLPKFIKRIRIPPEEILGFLGKESVEEAAKKLRTKNIPITVMDLYNVLEKMRDAALQLRDWLVEISEAFELDLIPEDIMELKKKYEEVRSKLEIYERTEKERMLRINCLLYTSPSPRDRG